MAVHKFGIIDNIEEKDYSQYKLESHNCVAIDDKLVIEIIKYLKNLKTYHYNSNKEEFGFDYNGITIIPTKSLSNFYDIVTTINQFKRSSELTNLSSLILTAKINEKCIIHYGVNKDNTI